MVCPVNTDIGRPMPTCLSCTGKHVARARGFHAARVMIHTARSRGFFKESVHYPHHRWLAVGELSLAEDEARELHPELAETIFAERKLLELDESYEPDWDDLFACIDRTMAVVADEEIAALEAPCRNTEGC